MSLMKASGQGPLFLVKSKLSDEDFQDVSSVGKFLPRIQLFTSTSTPVQNDEIEKGHYGLIVNKKIKDLGAQFDCIPLGVRAKAMDLRGIGGKKVVSVFDKRDPKFLEIRAASANTNSKCMFGSEFLLWLPSEEKFATFFFGNPTLRRVAPDLKELLGYPATLGVEKAVNEKGQWHAATIVECSTPINPLPSAEEAEEQINLFDAVNTAVEEEVEGTEEDEPARAR